MFTWGFEEDFWSTHFVTLGALQSHCRIRRALAYKLYLAYSPVELELTVVSASNQLGMTKGLYFSNKRYVFAITFSIIPQGAFISSLTSPLKLTVFMRSARQ